LERIKELVEQGWPTSQIRPQLEAEGLLTPKLIGLPSPVGDQEILVESVVGLRSFVERKFIDLSRQIEELRQLFITITLKQELQDDLDSPWQPLSKELAVDSRQNQAEEIAIGPNIGMPASPLPMNIPMSSALNSASISSQISNFTNIASASSQAVNDDETSESAQEAQALQAEKVVESKGPLPTAMGLGEITDQNYLTLLGRKIDQSSG
jgi:hypothetical protein